MQKKPNKLPYVFVEIDEADNSEDDVLNADASVLPYENPYASVIPGTYPQSYSMPPMGVPAPSPYMQNTGGFAPVMPAPYQVNPYSGMLEQDFNNLYQVDDSYLDDDIYDDFDDEDEEDAVIVNQESDDSGNDELNVATVVIPVFKNVESRKNKTKQNTFGHQYAQMPILPTMPFLQTLPFSYNPFRTPFVNPLWAISQMPMRGNTAYGAPLYPMQPQQPQRPIQNGQFAPSNMNQHMQGAPQNTPNTGVSNQQDPRRVRSSREPINQVNDAHKNQQNTSRDSLRLPAEAREAFAAPSIQKKAAGNAGIQAQMQQSRSHSQNPISGIPGNIVNPSTDTQTITANTDSVSVSVSVLPTNNSVETAAAVQPMSAHVQKVEDVQPSQGATPIALPVTKGSKTKKRNNEPKQPKESFQEMAMRENAEKTHTSLEESNEVDDMGKPLLDANAIATSDMFSTPTTSMNDSMTGFQFRSSRRKHVLVIVLVALILALVVAAVVCVFAVWSGAATISFDESNIPSIQLSGNSGS